jgi:hypothetical protein
MHRDHNQTRRKTPGLLSKKYLPNPQVKWHIERPHIRKERECVGHPAYWTPVDEPQKSNTLVYILQHPSREEAAANWKSFQDDPEWKSVRDKSEVNGKLTEKIDSTFLVLTDFSPPLR